MYERVAKGSECMEGGRVDGSTLWQCHSVAGSIFLISEAIELFCLVEGDELVCTIF